MTLIWPPVYSAILRVKVVGQDSEFGDRIEIGNDGGGHAAGLFGIGAIDQVAVGGLPSGR